ncbi:MAG: hypothetical protein LBI96_02215, partial [Odoribacteraceae bacterium]|nr:hypothetical protein [Odoribacteraceae bacterium]
MTNRYRGYSAEELLMDDRFLLSRRDPTPESNAFWQQEMAADPALKAEIERAEGFLALVKNSSSRLPDVEVRRLWERVNGKIARRHRAVRLTRAIAVGAAA